MKNQQLKDFMETRGLQQKQAAQMLGVSVATVSLYLKGQYAGDVASLDQKVDEMIARYKEKVSEAKYSSEFVSTLTARRGMDVIKYAHIEGELNVIYGAAGLGKTQMLKQYAKENSGAVLIEVDSSCVPKTLLKRIAKAIGATDTGTNDTLLEAITAKLKGSERVLLVDEAELLSTRSLEFIRRIHDFTGVGVVLAGMPRLLINLKGKNNELAQLYSRVSFALDLGNQLPASDLALLAENALGTSEYNDTLLSAAKGNARRLSKLMRGVVRTAEINGMEINSEMIKQYAGMLIN
ncbi:AAA family ATPase [Actinobacillus minor]|uniref:AAA family ATPase n=1 Tax=Actinobacillus minor TaxID=51047 RepID=UPI0023F3F314|nr:AAA family ATPase [Actinobacillus minor]MDD6911327.1 AAA family ATPase [Actinobacillus minor]